MGGKVELATGRLRGASIGARLRGRRLRQVVEPVVEIRSTGCRWRLESVAGRRGNSIRADGHGQRGRRHFGRRPRRQQVDLLASVAPGEDHSLTLGMHAEGLTTSLPREVEKRLRHAFKQSKVAVVQSAASPGIEDEEALLRREGSVGVGVELEGRAWAWSSARCRENSGGSGHHESFVPEVVKSGGPGM